MRILAAKNQFLQTTGRQWSQAPSMFLAFPTFPHDSLDIIIDADHVAPRLVVVVNEIPIVTIPKD
jgi:predicted ester cyclase